MISKIVTFYARLTLFFTFTFIILVILAKALILFSLDFIKKYL